MAEAINNEDIINDVARSAGLQRKKDRIEVVIHTMPRRFLQTSNQSSDKGRHTGLYIILTGSFILMGVLAGLYYYLSKTTPPTAVSEADILAADKVAVNTGNQAISGETDNNMATSVASTAENNLNNAEEIIDPNSLAPDDSANIVSTTSDLSQEIDNGNIEENLDSNSEISEALVLKAAADIDVDGLSDIEEVILDSNAQIADSDGDGYTDLAELLKLYNPAGGGKIVVNPNIEKYTNSEYAYSLYYPKSWIVNSALGNNSVVFQLGGDEFIQILIEPKFTQATLDDWYKNQFGVDYIDAGKKIFKPGWAGIKSQDNLVAYLYNPSYDFLVIASYSPGKEVLKYPNLFDMMVASLEFAK